MTDKIQPLPSSLQEAVLTVLAVDNKFGSSIAGQVRPEHFDGQYRNIAAAVLSYRRKYSKAPGQAHLEEVVLGAVTDQQSVSSLRRVLGRLLVQAVNINTEYVANRAHEFVRGQVIKTALMEASDRFLQEQEEDLVPDVERILLTALTSRQEGLDAGIFMNDDEHALAFLDQKAKAYALDIRELDMLGIGPAHKQLLLYIAAKNAGKSWFAVHCGRQVLMQRGRVVHISLEMSEDEVLGRYHQTFFAASQKATHYIRTMLDVDSLKRYVGFTSERLKTDDSFDRPDVRQWLKTLRQPWGTHFGRLVVKGFPSGTLTIDHLTGYLDYLGAAHNFIPDAVIIDYPDLMSVDRNKFRLDLGRIYVDLRGIAQERNLAMVAPTQGNRDSWTASRVGGHMVSEDASKVMTADTVLTYSQTESENKLGLARLHVAYARHAMKGSTVLITQSYTTGQYVLESSLMHDKYWQQLSDVDEDLPDDVRD